jgi:hypothetical protein
MKLLPIAVGLAMLAPALAWGHGGGIDQYGCHHDAKKGDYHCHQGKLKGRSYKSQDTMLAAHPELRGGQSAGERAKKEKAEDKLKEGDKTTTDEYAQDAKRKSSAKTR